MNAGKTLSCPPDNFPWRADTVPLVYVGNVVIQAQTKHEKLDLLNYARSNPGTIISVWPGEWKSGAFLIEDIDAARDGILGIDREKWGAVLEGEGNAYFRLGSRGGFRGFHFSYTRDGREIHDGLSDRDAANAMARWLVENGLDVWCEYEDRSRTRWYPGTTS